MIYDYKVEKQDGSFLELRDLKGKVILIVNTATKCGFTPQYEDLENLYEKYHDKGLEIIDIPCNQFKEQAPESDSEITHFCQINYNIKFPQMKKADVNGENEIELYKFLKSQKGFEGFGKGPKAIAMSTLLKTIDKDYKNNPDIKWNFTKFLVNRDGEVVARFEPTEKMTKIDEKIAELI
ncbi:glutathione peroxidase [Peptoniphilus porci]|uniref:Glutathione peroxidase n=1 Tax=Peptoniphilus porci TaxID=2652280 RepID=A0A1U7LYJ1_9FIRM|nr:glutathione peroxidase [Peptoniphilus porci]OLR64479.1 glutathione peroxidase [Peptoniphilus porci]